MLLKNRINELTKIIKSDNILTSREECYCYSADSAKLNSDYNAPDIVIFVETTEDIQKVMKYAYAHDIPVTSRGAGTNTVGACLCNNGGIVLNFSKMNKIIEINKSDMTATVQPGVILGDLKNAVEKEGLFFPPDPSNFAVSTIGGAIAQSSGGAMAFKYGTTKDYVLSLKVVTSDGKIMNLGAGTSKDSVGYHLSQLMVGSEGTLAIIAEAKLKLIPKPETKRTILAYFDSTEKAVTVVNKIINSGIYPAAIDYMDKNSISTVEEFSKCGLDPNKECLLLILIDGYNSSIQEQIEKTLIQIKGLNSGYVKVSDTDEFWNARRTSFSAASRIAPDVLTDDIIVPRENIGQMIQNCQDIANKYNLKMCLISHIGDGNIHPQIALNLENDEEFKNYYIAKGEMYKTAIGLGGTISAEHGVGFEKKQYIKNAVDEPALEYMKLIKKVFDPKGILNPGKIFD